MDNLINENDIFKDLYDDEFYENVNSIKVEVPHAFQFPFQPYDIQLSFMQKLYEVLELEKIGIFESPTGTGKSLSLICGALTWLKHFEDRKENEFLNIEKQINEVLIKKEVTTDWLQEFAFKQSIEEKRKLLMNEHEKFLNPREKLKQLRQNHLAVQQKKRKRNSLDECFNELFTNQAEVLASIDAAESGLDAEAAEDDVIVDDYHSEGEEEGEGKLEEEIGPDAEQHILKIYYCSRTHSQLTQFIGEVKRSPFREEISLVNLASRQNLCVNEAVKKLKSLNLINEKCLDLQNKKSSKTKKSNLGCPFFKRDAITELSNKALIEIKDIEELGKMGKVIKACPYYAARQSIPLAQLVVLPYNTILCRSTRVATGINLSRNIVIIDEGHNLIDALANMHSVLITGSQLCCSFSQLSQYYEKYNTRLNAKNSLYIKQILFILSAFIKILGGKAGVEPEVQELKTEDDKIKTICDFLFEAKIDNFNFYKIEKYFSKTLISRKLCGFIENYQPIVKSKDPKKNTISKFLKGINTKIIEKSTENISGLKEEDPSIASPLMYIESFFKALISTDHEGRILIHRDGKLRTSYLKFLLLNPAIHFADVVKEARSVIIAGGTMQPISEFKNQLLLSTHINSERIVEFSCGHIITASSLLPLVLERGSSGLQLDFTFQKRITVEMMNELGRIVYNMCNVVPCGVVCFFPSYDYEMKIFDHWSNEGYIAKIENKKKIFREPKLSSDVDKILEDYSTHIYKCSNKIGLSNQDGAILFCVVGGKMSEGINFSDDLGRCVLMVGLPYPNIESIELKEKMNYLNSNLPQRANCPKPGQLHFENLCMKAVNQCIGRAIRHKNDYACILLLDYRYARPSIRAKLPRWISEHLQTQERFGPAFQIVRKFFISKASSKVKQELF